MVSASSFSLLGQCVDTILTSFVLILTMSPSPQPLLPFISLWTVQPVKTVLLTCCMPTLRVHIQHPFFHLWESQTTTKLTSSSTGLTLQLPPLPLNSLHQLSHPAHPCLLHLLCPPLILLYPPFPSSQTRSDRSSVDSTPRRQLAQMDWVDPKGLCCRVRWASTAHFQTEPLPGEGPNSTTDRWSSHPIISRHWSSWFCTT